MIAHVVLFTPRADLDAAAREALIGALEKACLDIPRIRRVRIGRRRVLGYAYDTISPVHFEFAAILEFDSEADLRAYLLHPATWSLANASRRLRPWLLPTISR
jgi:hypothetical protein